MPYYAILQQAGSSTRSKSKQASKKSRKKAGRKQAECKQKACLNIPASGGGPSEVRATPKTLRMLSLHIVRCEKIGFRPMYKSAPNAKKHRLRQQAIPNGTKLGGNKRTAFHIHLYLNLLKFFVTSD